MSASDQVSFMDRMKKVGKAMVDSGAKTMLVSNTVSHSLINNALLARRDMNCMKPMRLSDIKA